MMTSAWVLQGFGSSTIGGGVLPNVEAYSPASIVAQYLLDQGIASAYGDDLDWPIFVSRAPHGEGVPLEIISAYDTTGTLDGRSMRTGQTNSKPGVNLRIRASSQPSGWGKAYAIQETLDAARREVVVLGDFIFRLDNVSRTTDIVSLGPEVETELDLFSYNAKVTITRLA